MKNNNFVILVKDTTTVLMIGFFIGLHALFNNAILILWLKDYGVDYIRIGFAAFANIPFIFSFLWGPVVEHYKPPIFAKLGKRRGWVFTSQIIIIVCNVLFALIDPNKMFIFTLLLASLTAFMSGCNDAAMFAYRAHYQQKYHIYTVSSLITLGCRLGMLIVSSGGIYIASFFGWPYVFMFIILCAIINCLIVLLEKEPSRSLLQSSANVAPTISDRMHFRQIIDKCLWAPLQDILKTDNGKMALYIACTFKLSDAMVHRMAYIMYIDIGFSKIDIANIVQLYGSAMSIISTIICGFTLKHVNIHRMLFWSTVLHVFSNFSYFVVYYITPCSTLALCTAIAVENFTGGMMVGAFGCILAALNPNMTDFTKYTLLWSINYAAGAVIKPFGGVIVYYSGWVLFFVIIQLLSIPNLLITYYAAYYNDNKNKSICKRV